MELRSTRLVLRDVVLSDVNNIHNLHSIPMVDQYNTMGLPKNTLQTAAILNDWISHQQMYLRAKYVFCIETPAHEFVGLLGLNMGKAHYRNAECWYKIHPDHWNKGYATEGVQRLLSFCFNELKLHRVTAGTATQNTASIAVLEKCGFTREAHHRKILPIRGEWFDNYEFAILEEDFVSMSH
jgi:ribosomal-protein-alanine N-acetyltransferase